MRVLFRSVLNLMGWKIVGELPDDKKYIVIVAPHTSNWDLVIGLLARFAIGVKINFLGKSEIFFFPMNIFLKAVGGIPVDRTRHCNLVAQIVELYKQSDTLRLGLAPEGTRSPVQRWKEGFYHIACQANIPIVMVGFDYSTKEVRIDESFKPSGEIGKDFEHIIAYFRTIRGCHPKVLPDYHAKEL